MNALQRFWLDMNYRYCMSQRYLASQRGDTMLAIDWERRAWDWLQQWRQA